MVLTDHLVAMKVDEHGEEQSDALDLPPLPDVDKNYRLLGALIKSKEQEERKRAAQARARERSAAERAGMEEDEEAGHGAITQMEALQQQLGLDMSALLEEYQETQQVLLPVDAAGDAGLGADCEPEYLEGVTSALGALGVAPSFLPAPAEAAGGGVEAAAAALLAEGVRCGYVGNETLRRGAAPAPVVDSLFRLLYRSGDMEVAGAAFVALLTLLGEPGLEDLMLDPTYGLPAADSPVYSSLPRPCRVDSLPTIRSLYDALRANGYTPSPPPAERSSLSKQLLGRRAAAAGPGAEQRGGQGSGAAAGEGGGGGSEVPRIQAVKLILRTTVAVCRYCQQHPQLRGPTLDRDALADLLLAVAHLGLDPYERLLLDDLDDAALALLEAFEEGDWQRKLPWLAERLGERAGSATQHMRMLKRLPAGSSPRALALQQLSAALLLGQLIPAKGKAPPPVPRRAGAALDPTAVIAAQPWYSNPKGLVAEAVSGGQGSVPRGRYSIGQVELLLKLCHLLLWPHMQRFAEGAADTPITRAFLAGWCANGGFLDKLAKSIKKVQAEDHACKALAQALLVDYEEFMRKVADRGE